MGLEQSGVLSAEELAKLPGMPSAARMQRGPVAVIECAQEIPCNPCEALCRQGAIGVGDLITNLPTLDEDKCTGCGLCIAGCPGQAIFAVDTTHSETEAVVAMPYELLPLPQVGQAVDGLDREGQAICTGHVVKVLTPRRFDRTAVVTVAVPQECAMSVRNIALRRQG
jgi:Fe-S-cluster-containing hydrogenase component 2